jgi:hypothetical protein
MGIAIAQPGRPRTVSTYAELTALTGQYVGERVPVTGLGARGHEFWWNGSIWVPEGGRVVLAQNGTGLPFIEPAATFTSVSVSDNGGNVQLSSAGVHGLTTSPAAGKSIYVSAGTGWTVGFYTILTVDDTDSITIDLAYDAGLGSPTIALANTEVTAYSITVPGGLIGSNGYINLYILATCTNNANVKTIRAKLGGTTYFDPNLAADLDSSSGAAFERKIANRNSQSSQVVISKSSVASYSTVPAANTSGTVNTAIDQTLAITLQPSTENDNLKIEAYSIEVVPG